MSRWAASAHTAWQSQLEFAEMKRLSLSLAIACVIVLSACSTLRVGEDFDHQASFTRYHSYNLMEREHHGTANPLVVQRARDAIEAELKRKGFAAAATAEQADLIVDFTIGSRYAPIRRTPLPMRRLHAREHHFNNLAVRDTLLIRDRLGVDVHALCCDMPTSRPPPRRECA